MMKVNYGIKVELGPSGQPMYSVRKNDFPMSIHVVDMKTAAAVVELLQQEYVAGFCAGNEDTLKSMTMREPTQDEVDDYLIRHGLRTAPINEMPPMPDWAFRHWGIDEDDTKRQPGALEPKHFTEAYITPRLHDLAEAYYKNECGLDEEQVASRLLSVMYDVHDGEAMRVALVAHLSDLESESVPEDDEPYTLGDIIREQMASNYDSEEEMEEAISFIDNIFGNGDRETLHQFDHVPCCGLPPIDGAEVGRMIKGMCPPDTKITHCGDKPLCMDSGYDDELEADPITRGENYVPPPCCEFDSNGDEILKDVVPRALDPISRDYEKIITAMAHEDPDIEQMCVTAVFNHDEMIKSGWEAYQKPFHDGVEQAYVKRVEPEKKYSSLDDIDKHQAAIRDPRVLRSVTIPNECLVNYLGNNWEFYDKFDDKSVVVVLYKTPHNG